MDDIKRGRTRNTTSCCVMGCYNRYSNTEKDVIFYSFPSRPYDKDKRELWIKNINRRNPEDDSLWKPSKYSKICSKHFVNNVKSNHPHHPSYAPTLFPKADKLYPKRKRKIFPKLVEVDTNWFNAESKEEDISIDFDESGNAKLKMNADYSAQDISEDPLSQEYDENLSKSSTATTEINSIDPEILDFVKVDLCEDPLDIQEQDISQCPDPLEKTKFEDDFVRLVRVEDCSKPVKTVRRRKRFHSPPKTEKFGVEIKRLNGLNNVVSTLANFEVKSLPLLMPEDEFSEKVVLEIKIAPRGEMEEMTIMNERIQQMLEKDIMKSNKIGKLQKIIATQKKKIEQLTQVVSHHRRKIINAEHDYGLAQ